MTILKLAIFTLASSCIYVCAQTGIPSDCDRTYVVQAGDTCDSISDNNDVSSFQLTFVNTEIDGNCDNIFPGEVLCLGRNGQDCTVVHTVGSGESCVEIANNAGTTLNILLENNPNVDPNCDNLRIEEVLCTESTLIPYHSS